MPAPTIATFHLPHTSAEPLELSVKMPAIEEITARGYSINVTLIFSLTRQRQVAGAYLRPSEGSAKAPKIGAASAVLPRSGR